MMRWLGAAVLSLAGLAGCAPSVIGGAPVVLSPELAAGSRVDVIWMSSDWLRSEPDFSDTFTDELREELTLCADGARALNLRVHIDDLRRGGRLDAALGGVSAHSVSGVVEFVDPRTRAVVGRYPIQVAAGTTNPLAALVADRQMVISEAFAREVCRQAFGRNPRGHPLTRATGD
jgi:hypothetical protein